MSHQTHYLAYIVLLYCRIGSIVTVIVSYDCCYSCIRLPRPSFALLVEINIPVTFDPLPLTRYPSPVTSEL